MRTQSHLMSLVESIANVAVGFLLALGTQLAIFPLLGIVATFSDNLLLGCIFTVMSLVRSYLLRRVFESLRASQQQSSSSRSAA
jgi:membrane protein implicated in regulation of membrane protease activity